MFWGPVLLRAPGARGPRSVFPWFGAGAFSWLSRPGPGGWRARSPVHVPSGRAVPGSGGPGPWGEGGQPRAPGLWSSASGPWGTPSWFPCPLLGGRGLPAVELLLACGIRPLSPHGRGAPRDHRPRKHGWGDHRAARAMGAFGPGGTRLAEIVAEQTCFLWLRGEPAPYTCSGARPFTWLSGTGPCG